MLTSQWFDLHSEPSAHDTDIAYNEWALCTIALSDLRVLPGVNSKCKIAWDGMTLGAAVDLDRPKPF